MGKTTGRALLIVSADPPPELEGELNRWYDEEHLADELRRVPGVVSARRYVAASAIQDEIFSGRPHPQHYSKYLTIFELETEETLGSPEYWDFLTNPTEWTRRIVRDVPITALVYRQVYPEEGFFTR
ncbi:MAG: hypothetical protein J4F46_08400 [Dehalococcoidia bacterium]|nr:hypothetical protein [Dehalococcoidia bacterium]